MNGRIRTMVWAAGLAAAVALGACSARRSEPVTGVSPEARVDTEEEARGRLVFMQWCNQCHPHGQAGLGPALNSIPLPEIAVQAKVRNHLGTMPVFGSDEISDPELDDLFAYLVALRRNE